MAMLRQVLLLLRDVPAGVRFFGAEGLGLPVLFASDKYALLGLHGPKAPEGARPSLALQQVDSEAQCSTGYSPNLTFDVADMDSVVQRLLGQGARLDGPIKYPVQGKVAAIRSPDGHMLGLFEPNPDLADPTAAPES